MNASRRGTRRPGAPERVLCAVALLLLGAGCMLIGPDGTPRRTALVTATGMDGASLDLIVSPDFFVGTMPGGDTRTEIWEADTIPVTLPFERTFSIRSASQILVQLVNRGAEPVWVHMEVFLDGDRFYSEAADLDPDEWLHFSYRFRSFE